MTAKSDEGVAVDKSVKKYFYIGGALIAVYLVFWLLSNILWYFLIIGLPLIALWLYLRHKGWLKT
jgi:Flp pilus assembly protein TadB